MVTYEEIKSKKFTNLNNTEKVSYHVTTAEMQRFEGSKELGLMLYNKIDNYVKTNHLKPKYEKLEDLCQISETSLKKSCTGTQKITRLFLYKLSVGLKMSVEEANEYFALCGGVLKADNLEDYICMRALEDKDDILHFIEQFNEYVSKFDKHQTVNKLKTLYE